MDYKDYADYETSKMAQELGMIPNSTSEFTTEKTLCHWGGHKHVAMKMDNKIPSGIHSHIWYQIEKWLWEKQLRMWIHSYRYNGEYYVTVYREGANIIQLEEIFDSPLTAKIEGIKKAVEYLWEDKFGKNV